MLFRALAIPTLLAALLACPLWAQDAPATQPADEQATQPAATIVVATVGDAKITSDDVAAAFNRVADRVPWDQVAEARAGILSELIFQKMLVAYLDAKQIGVDQDEYDKMKAQIAATAESAGATPEEFMVAAGVTEEDIKQQVRVQTLMKAAAGEEQSEAFMKANPDYFNGTTVQASHILIACSPVAPTSEQKAAVEKLEGLAKQIAAGEVSFEDAAKANSTCPSKDKGGDLGEFTFDRMVAPFAIKAFSMEAGQVSDVVRTQFGFHIIKVTAKTPGEQEPAPTALAVAQRALMAKIECDVFALPLSTLPVTVKGK